MTTEDQQRHSELKKYRAQLQADMKSFLIKGCILFNTLQEIDDQLEELEASQ